ncbi:hypothetical protein [uncultured Novosphingobium sp.]|uniref:hypothetical protein n=1 Tax=uncultured Novosphingobium sp. TaxID=292277 RepID=UPI003747EB7F
MAYEVTIRCDVRQGNPLTKKRCHSDAQAREIQLREEAPLGPQALRLAEDRAKGLGWKRVRRASRPTIWVCPACT